MITIQLKVKHYYLIADILFGQAAYTSFSILEKIKTACINLNENDLASIEVSVSDFIQVFGVLSSKPEGSFNRINTEMIDLLTPQIELNINLGNEEWISLAQQIQQMREINWQVPSEMINNGKYKLGL